MLGVEQEAGPRVRATADDEATFRRLMARATWALVVLWTLLFTIGALGAFKSPA